MKGKVQTTGEVGFTIQGKVLIILVIFLFAQGYALNNLVPTVIASLLLGYLAFARFSFDEQLGSTSLSATRHGKEKAFEDRPFPASLEIYNDSPNSTLIDVVDDIPGEADAVSGRHRMRAVIEPQQSGKISYILRPIARGKLVLDRFRIEVMDERGLMSTEIAGSSPLVIDVQPPIERFRGGEVILRRDQVATAGSSTSNRLGRGYEFGGLRQYVPDDSFTSIEWKASSRLAKLMTKLMYEETRASVYIFLDCSRSMRLKSSPAEVSKLDQVLYHAVQVTSHLSKGGFPVSLGAYDEHRVLKFESLRAGRSRSGLLEIVAEIPGGETVRAGPRGTGAVSDPDPGSGLVSRILPFFGRRGVRSSEKATGLYAAVERLAFDRAKSGVVVIFSDLRTNPRSVQLAARTILRRGHRLIIVTPFSPSFEGKGGRMSPELLERLYTEYRSKRSLMRRLERMGARVVEVEKGKEAARELSRRLSRG